MGSSTIGARRARGQWPDGRPVPPRGPGAPAHRPAAGASAGVAPVHLNADPRAPRRIAQEGRVPEGHVITVTGPRSVAELGVVDAHDHLLMDSPGMPGQGFTDVDKAIEEARDGQATGIGTLVEMTPIGLGRNPAGLRAVAEATGLADHRRERLSPGRALPRGLVGPRRHGRDAPATGSSRTSRPGCTRRTGSTRRCPSTRRGPGRSRAARRTTTSRAPSGGASRRSPGPPPRPAPPSSSTRRSGRPPTRSSTCSKRAGATTDRIALAHLDRNPDWELHAEIAARGVTLEYDTIGRTKYHPDSVVLDLIERVAAAGHLDRIVLGLDLGARSYLRAYDGGPGPAVPHGDVRAPPPPPAGRRRGLADPRREPGAPVRDAGRRERGA